jgi:hypothetical protein
MKEIDDVLYMLKASRIEAGDKLAHEWGYMLETATRPGAITEFERNRIRRRTNQVFSEHEKFLDTVLNRAGLLEGFNNAFNQATDCINARIALHEVGHRVITRVTEPIIAS